MNMTKAVLGFLLALCAVSTAWGEARVFLAYDDQWTEILSYRFGASASADPTAVQTTRAGGTAVARQLQTIRVNKWVDRLSVTIAQDLGRVPREKFVDLVVVDDCGAPAGKGTQAILSVVELDSPTVSSISTSFVGGQDVAAEEMIEFEFPVMTELRGLSAPDGKRKLVPANLADSCPKEGNPNNNVTPFLGPVQNVDLAELLTDTQKLALARNTQRWFLQIDGAAVGNSSAPGMRGWSDITDVSLTMSDSPLGSGNNPVQMGDLTLTKPVDALDPTLEEALASGRRLASATLKAVDSAGNVVAQYRLGGVQVTSSYSGGIGANGNLGTNVALHFDRIDVGFAFYSIPHKASSSLVFGGSNGFAWSAASNAIVATGGIGAQHLAPSVAQPMPTASVSYRYFLTTTDMGRDHWVELAGFSAGTRSVVANTGAGSSAVSATVQDMTLIKNGSVEDAYFWAALVNGRIGQSLAVVIWDAQLNRAVTAYRLDGWQVSSLVIDTAGLAVVGVSSADYGHATYQYAANGAVSGTALFGKTPPLPGAATMKNFAAAAQGAPALTYFAQFDGVNGDAADPAHAGWFEASGFSFGASGAGDGTRDVVLGSPTLTLSGSGANSAALMRMFNNKPQRLRVDAVDQGGVVVAHYDFRSVIMESLATVGISGEAGRTDVSFHYETLDAMLQSTVPAPADTPAQYQRAWFALDVSHGAQSASTDYTADPPLYSHNPGIVVHSLPRYRYMLGGSDPMFKVFNRTWLSVADFSWVWPPVSVTDSTGATRPTLGITLAVQGGSLDGMFMNQLGRAFKGPLALFVWDETEQRVVAIQQLNGVSLSAMGFAPDFAAANAQANRVVTAAAPRLLMLSAQGMVLRDLSGMGGATYVWDNTNSAPVSLDIKPPPAAAFQPGGDYLAAYQAFRFSSPQLEFQYAGRDASASGGQLGPAMSALVWAETGGPLPVQVLQGSMGTDAGAFLFKELWDPASPTVWKGPSPCLVAAKQTLPCLQSTDADGRLAAEIAFIPDYVDSVVEEAGVGGGGAYHNTDFEFSWKQAAAIDIDWSNATADKIQIEVGGERQYRWFVHIPFGTSQAIPLLSVGRVGRSGKGTITLSAANGALDWNGGGTVLHGDPQKASSLTASLDQINAALQSLRYTPKSGYSGLDSIDVKLHIDGFVVQKGEGIVIDPTLHVSLPINVSGPVLQ